MTQTKLDKSANLSKFDAKIKNIQGQRSTIVQQVHTYKHKVHVSHTLISPVITTN